MIKVGITGQAGFIGGHLFNWLNTQKEEIILVPFERNFFQSTDKLEKFANTCDVIVHLAGKNRASAPEVIYRTNVQLTEALIQASEKAITKPFIVFSSSIQEETDNIYGKSKVRSRELLEKNAADHGSGLSSLLIPNVFGPYGLPNYNSFIATFCHKLILGEEPEIIQDAQVDLIYVQELVEAIYYEIKHCNNTVKTIEVNATSHIKVSEVLNKLSDYTNTYYHNGVIPKLETIFDYQLFNTYRGYIPTKEFKRSLTPHADQRGVFVEIMRAGISGQTSFSTTVPGITRGNHYHTRKIERFAVIKGKALIQLRKVNSDEVYEYYLRGEEPSFVDMPIWFTHNIQNIGKDELITLFWINEPYDPNDPDTYFEKV